MNRRVTQLKDLFRSLVRRDASEWLELHSGWFGDLEGNVNAGNGKVFVRLYNHNVVEVVNRLEPGRANIPVKIGRSRTLPSIWQVVEIRDVFDDPPGGGSLPYHYRQHMYGAEDMVPIHRKQITQLTVVPAPVYGAFHVLLYGDLRLRSGAYIKISTQLRNLSSYVPTTGAIYVVIESNNSGTLSDNVGSSIASPEVATPSDIPLPASGKYPQAVILLYEGQTAIKNSDIAVPWPTDFNPVDYSGPGHTHTMSLDDLDDVTVPAPTDGQVLTFDFYSGEWIAADSAGGGGSAHTIQEEGTPLAARANLNFVGGGVTATDDVGNNATVVTIPPNLTTEEVEDIVGAMVAGNTETGIAVTYDDAGAKLNFDAQTAGDARYAPIAKGVTNGDSHDHTGGDGATLKSKMFVMTYLAAATVPASTTYHTAPNKPTLDAAANNIPFPFTGVLNNLIVRIASTQPASGTLVITMTIANVDTALVVTIPAGSTQGSYSFSTDVSIAAGDLIKWKVVNNATTTSAQFTAITMGYEIEVAP